MRPLHRRDFLRLSAYTVAAASAPIACGEDAGPDDQTPLEDVDALFPQGVASGDPTPSSVILWTRVTPRGGLPEEVELELALDEAFTQLLPLEKGGIFAARPEDDHTLRVKITSLAPYTTYYYRFTARGVTGIVGRTRTAPAPDQDVKVRFAFASCQDFVGRYWHAWENVADEDLDFVLHLGDYVYETTGDPRFQETVAPRRKITLPDGMEVKDEVREFRAAKTLADYRSLYKQYRSDPALRKVHARFAFVNIWDDHEFSDDCWGDHGTYFSEKDGNTEEDPARRHAANRAWYEYQPADVTFNDAAASPDDIQIYRSLRFGKHVELFLTDDRSYRDDHLIPEGPAGSGKLLYKSANSPVGARQFVLKSYFDPLEAAKYAEEQRPTLLGSKQLDWLKQGMTTSEATWKLLGSQVQLAQMTVNLKKYVPIPPYNAEFYLTVDQWDGYRSERADLLGELQDVPNVVTLCGDIHAFYACELRANPDDVAAPVAAVEFTCAGISSQSIGDSIAELVDGSELFKQLGLEALVPEIDQVITESNLAGQYVYANSNANGIALAEVSAGDVKVEFRRWDAEAILLETYVGPAEVVRFSVTAGVKKLDRL